MTTFGGFDTAHGSIGFFLLEIDFFIGYGALTVVFVGNFEKVKHCFNVGWPAT